MRIRILTLLILLAAGAAPAAASASVTHLVARGESLTSVAAADGLSVAALAAANGIAPDAGLVSGSEIVIPARGAEADPATSGDPATPATSATRATPATPATGGSYRVALGDTLSGIAARAGVSVAALAAANGLTVAGILPAGMTLSLDGAPAPVATSVAAPVAASVAPPASTASAPQAGFVSPQDVGAAAERVGVPSALAQAIAEQESGFNDGEVSRTGAVGVMQIEPGTWRYIHSELGASDLGTGAEANVAGGVILLRSLLDATGGSETQAAAAYYQGLRSLRRHGMYADTERYVADVMALAQRFGG